MADIKYYDNSDLQKAAMLLSIHCSKMATCKECIFGYPFIDGRIHICGLNSCRPSDWDIMKLQQGGGGSSDRT